MGAREQRPIIVAQDSRRAIAPAELVTIELFEAICGYTDKAVRGKRDDGTWRVGADEVLVKAPDGRILVNLPRFYEWAKGEKAPE